MSQDNLQKLNIFFDKYIDRMLIRDIELIKSRNDEFRFSYPYILLASSCIDLFGGIEKGFTDSSGHSNSKDRFMWFVRKWMGQINRLYREESLAYLIYDSWRCGVSHQATLKRGFETSSYMYSRGKHLHYINDNKRVFIHSIQFVDDMVAAQKLYRKSINDKASDSGYIDSLYQHLADMIGDENQIRTTHLDQLIQILQQNNLTFDSSSSIPTTTSASTSPRPISNPPITRLPDESICSAAPEEDDLE